MAIDTIYNFLANRFERDISSQVQIPQYKANV